MTLSRLTSALALGLVLLGPGALHAQLLTTDPANTAEVATVANRILQTLEYATKIVEWYDRAQVVLANPGRYRTAAIAAIKHDTKQYPLGGDFLSIFNDGDARGERWMRNVRKIAEYKDLLMRLPPDQRARMVRKIATREIADSIGQRGGHVVGQMRQNGTSVADVLLEIEDAIMNPRTAMHFTTVNLEKANALSLANARQTENQSIAPAHILGNRTFQTKRQTDAMTSALNAQINNLGQAPVNATASIAGTTEAIRGFSRIF